MSRLLVLLLLCLTALSARAEVRVLTSIKPLQLIAAAVQQGAGSPDVLLPPGASPHHFALRPSDVRRVADVDLLYWVGPDLEGFLPRVLAGRDKPSVAAVIEVPIPQPRDQLSAKEHPEFLRLRRELYGFLGHGH